MPLFADSWTATASAVPAARHAVLAHLRRADTPDPPLSDVALAVSEAVTNVVVHAYVDAQPGPVHVTVEPADERGELKLVVEDEGHGLRPRTDSPGIGLGLPLMATVSSRLDTRVTASGGTRLCVWFSLEPEAATLPH
jgi:serine/threonine-protein kinase RsbW